MVSRGNEQLDIYHYFLRTWSACVCDYVRRSPVPYKAYDVIYASQSES